MQKPYLMNGYARLKRHYWRMVGKVLAVAEPYLPSRLDAGEESSSSTRNVIIHYHNFKSAGTSVDYILQNNFGGRWMEWDETNDPDDIARLIAQRRSLKAISSHSVAIRLPDMQGIRLYPIVFMRHPIDRVVSMYRFYNKYSRHPGKEAEQARQTDLRGFIEWQLGCGSDYRNYYALRFSQWKTMPAYLEKPELERARETIEQLPFVGLVDHFEASLTRLQAYLKPSFPDFQVYSVHANVTSTINLPLYQRLEALRKEVGDRLYDRLIEENREDIALYHIILARYAA